MAYFARKIRYAANTCCFVALIEIAKKKGGRPIKFVLYRYGFHSFSRGQIFEMIKFDCSQEDDARENFPYGPVVYEDPIMEFEKNLDFPKYMRRKNIWLKTTDWLYDVAVGGGYQLHPDGSWVKVGRPWRWKDRQKKKRKVLRFGELGHIYKVYEYILENLREERCGLDVSVYDDFGNVIEEYQSKELEEINEEISRIEEKLNGLKEEMKYIYGKKIKNQNLA